MMKTYEVALSGLARSRILDLEIGEKQLFLSALWRELRRVDGRTIQEGEYFMRLVRSYWVAFRPLSDDEKERFKTRDGHFVIDIDLILDVLIRSLGNI